MHFCCRYQKINNLMRLRQSIRGARFNFCTLLGGVALFCAVFLAGCGQKEQESPAVPQCGEGVQFEPVGSSFFSIGKLCGVDVAELRSVVGKDSLVHRYVMMDSAAASLGTDLRRRGFPAEWLSAFVLRVPLRRVVALSTSQVGYLLRLGLRDNIIGVSDANYIVDSVLYYRTQRGSSSAQTAAVAGAPKFVESIGYDADALEKLMALSPDLIFDFTTGGDYDNYEQIARTSLPLMLTSEWQEDSPLAKLEWIKLYGILFGIRPLADSIYEDEKNKYETLKKLIASSITNDSINPKATEGRDPIAHSPLPTSNFLPPTKHCPRVLAGMSYGGVWHASGGNSFTANLIRDAGGCYVWAADTSRELAFSFEKIMALADSVDVWVNPSMFGNVDEMLALEPRIEKIKAFKEKQIFQNDGVKGIGAGNDFYEGAVTRPAELLWNLTKCINGTVPTVNSLDTSAKWYRNIYNF